jgi:hypothetical protein
MCVCFFGKLPVFVCKLFIYIILRAIRIAEEGIEGGKVFGDSS